jgi:hypothetical protein
MRKILIILFLFSFHSFAKTETVEMAKNKKITLDLNDDWEFVKDLFGVPLTVLGPWENESRPVILYTPTGVNSDKFPEEEFQKIFLDFRKEKEAWVKSLSGKLVSFEPMTTIKFKNAHGHYIGAEFIIDDITFSERSFYLFCKKELYSIKWSLRDEHKKYLPELQRIVESFQCE